MRPFTVLSCRLSRRIVFEEVHKGKGFRGPLSRKAGAVRQFARGHNSQLAMSVRAWNMVWSTTEMHRTKTCSTCHVAIVRPRPIGSSNRLDDVQVLSVIIIIIIIRRVATVC